MQLESRQYSVDEVKYLLGLDGFEYSQHFIAWNKAFERSIDWDLIKRVTDRFNQIDPRTLDGLSELIQFISGFDSENSISLVGGCSWVSMRIGPSVSSGVVKDAAWLNVGTFWDGQYYLGLSQTGEKGMLTWGTGKCLRIPLGDDVDLSHKATRVMAQALGKRVPSAVAG